MTHLTYGQLRQLIESVFKPSPGEKELALLTDLPSNQASDHPAWQDRRVILRQWYDLLQLHRGDLPFSAVRLYEYPDVGSNNNNLPDRIMLIGDDGESGKEISLISALENSTVVIAMTEYSATAPLKVLGRKMGFRGATMPGFSRKMIPALGLDYEMVNQRVLKVKTMMDHAESISICLEVSGNEYTTVFDTRHRTGHASGGLMREPGTVGNLPSGEAYIVPYEGEQVDCKSKTAGVLPVQFGQEIVLYEILENRARSVASEGPQSDMESARLVSEPAYGNMAEVGIGVLGQWGVEAVGSTLLDEKLGLHVAFGRSEHFGGITGPDSFRDPKQVVHIDRVYVPSLQPDVHVADVSFWSEGKRRTIMTNGDLII